MRNAERLPGVTEILIPGQREVRRHTRVWGESEGEGENEGEGEGEA